MPTELFISGKNWVLSLAELIAYFRNRNIPFEIQFFSREFFAIDFEQDIDFSIINDMGGTIKIGKARGKVPTETVKEAFLKKNKSAQDQISNLLASIGLVDDNANSESFGKLIFGISVYCTDSTIMPFSGTIQRFVGSTIKDQWEILGKKAKFIGYSRDRKKAQLSHVEVLKKKLVENNNEVLFCIGRDETWIATTAAVHNPFEFQKRDIYKPNQRKIFAMPPRLARIMVNLSSCKEGKVLLDPFCGVGTILQEALLEKAIVLGIDVNSWCVKATEENLEWLTKEYALEHTDFRILQGNIGKVVEKVGVDSVDCIVSEPDLGPALRQVPTNPYAKKIITKLEPLFFEFLEQAYRVLKPGGRLVLVTPYIKTRSKQPEPMSIDNKLESTGFKRVHVFSRGMFTEKVDAGKLVHTASLIEIDERHKTGREIHVLEK